MSDLRSSAGALLRLIPWPWILGIAVGMSFAMVDMAVERDSSLFLPAVIMPDGAWLWFAAFLVAGAGGLLCAYGIGRVGSSESARMLPLLEAGLRKGLAVVAVALGSMGGITLLALGQGPLNAVALATFSACVFLIWSWAATWLERRLGSSSPWSTLPLLPLPFVWIFTPAIPWQLGSAVPLATVGVSLVLSAVLVRFVPLLAPHAEGSVDLVNATEGGHSADVLTRWPRAALASAHVRPGAWIRTPVRAGLEYWWLTLAGRGLGGTVVLGIEALLTVGIVWMTVAAGHWLLLLPLMIMARVGPLPVPLDSLSVPMGRASWARVAWTGELIQAWAKVAAGIASLALVHVLVPEQVLAVSGPHPALILGALAVCLPLNGALDTAMGVHGSSLAIGRRMISKSAVFALAWGMVFLLDWSPPGVAGFVLAGAAFAGTAAAFLLFRHHLARCSLGPADA